MSVRHLRQCGLTMAFGDQRKPLKRTDFTRKAPSNTGRKPRGPVRRQAPRRASEEAEYRALRRRLLPPDRVVPCVAGFPGCTGRATELHHLRKRSAAGALANPAGVASVCHGCNMWIEDHPTEAHAAGLVVREGDPEWDALSARAWRKR